MVRAALRISFQDSVKGTTQAIDLSSLGISGAAKKTVELNIPAGGWVGDWAGGEGWGGAAHAWRMLASVVLNQGRGGGGSG